MAEATYLRLAQLPVGLLVNFNVLVLNDPRLKARGSENG